MNIKKWFVTVVAVLVSTAAFALPTPPDDDDPMAQALAQYTAQIAEMNKTFDRTILPPLKTILNLAQEIGASEQDPTPEQEQALAQAQTKLLGALQDFVLPAMAELDMNAVNEQLNQFLAQAGQPAQELSREDFANLMVAMTTLTAINHFVQDKLLTQEEAELAMMLFFPQEDASGN